VIRTALSGIADGGGNHDVLELNFVASSDNAKMSGTDSLDRIDGTIDGYSVAIVNESNNINLSIADQFVKTLYSSINGGFERLVINLLNAQGSVLESSGDILLSTGFFSGLLGGSHYYGSDFSDLITVQNDASSWHYIETKNGNDTVIGSSGNDTCNISGDGNKSISLGDGNDITNWWSAGNSTIDGGAGSDDLYVSLDTSSVALSWMLKDDGEVHVNSGSVEIATIQNAGTSYLFTASSNHGEQMGDMVGKVSNVEHCTFIGADERTGKLILADVFADGGITDTTAPTIISATPSDNAASVPVGSDIMLTFSEAIQRGTGTIEIHTGSVTGQLVSANLTLIGNALKINPNNELAKNTHYFVSLSNGSIKDLAGNLYAGTTAYDFTTAGDVAPSIDFDGTPIGTPSSYEGFADFILDTTKQSLPVYLASFVLFNSYGATETFSLSDVNNDTLPDTLTANWTDFSGIARTMTASITWGDNGIFLAHPTTGATIDSKDLYGRMAFDAQGDAVGLYILRVNPVFTLTPEPRLVMSWLRRLPYQIRQEHGLCLIAILTVWLTR